MYLEGASGPGPYQAKAVLWVDDEAELLEPHRIFLRDKGFDVEAATKKLEAELDSAAKVTADAGRAREVLGWNSTTPINDGLRMTYEALAAT